MPCMTRWRNTSDRAKELWHGEEGHWAKGGRGEVLQRRLGEAGRSDLQARLDYSANQVGATTEQGVQILQSGKAPFGSPQQEKDDA